MARIAGIDLPKNKRGEIGLTYIYGIGLSTAQHILDSASIDRNKKVNQWNDEEQTAIRNIITSEIKVEGALRSEVQMSIKRLPVKRKRLRSSTLFQAPMLLYLNLK